MNSNMFSLNFSDVAKGAVVAVLVAVLGAIEQGLTAHGLDFMAYDWASILNLAVTAGIGYLGKNFLSSNGKFVGKIG